MTTKPKIPGKIIAIKKYFSTPENPVTMAEMKALTMADRAELGPLCVAWFVAHPEELE